MTLYTILGWRDDRDEAEAIWVEARNPLDAVRDVYEAYRGSGFRFVAALATKLRPSATWRAVVEARSAERIKQPRPMMLFTTVGYWRDSGESEVMMLEAGDGVEALEIALARTGGVDEIQMLAAFSGRVVPVLREAGGRRSFRGRRRSLRNFRTVHVVGRFQPRLRPEGGPVSRSAHR
ncbi:MAG: hypothetical protein HQL42_16480 [Alphaproteobacteria bacterium]|nr:hypothetical protein [Alphaproteobacteria bacterium]